MQLPTVFFHYPGISILEGGYDLDALQTSALAHVKVLMKGYPSPSASSNATGRLLINCDLYYIHT